MTDDPLELYLRELKSAPPLAPDEEETLLAKARNEGDRVAKKRVVTSYLARTAEIALRIRPGRLPPLDAIQEANLVLIRVIEDPFVRKPRRALERRIAEHFHDLSS